MGFSINSANLVSPGSVGVTFTGSVSIQKNSIQYAYVKWSNEAQGTKTIWTVTSGKTCRIIGINARANAAGNTYATTAVRINGGVCLYATAAGTTYSISDPQASYRGSYADALIATSGQVIDCVTTVTGGTITVAEAEIYYIEE